MKARETDNEARQERLVQIRGRRALFALLRKWRRHTTAANAAAKLSPLEGRGPAAIATDPEFDDVTWRSKVF